MAERQQGIVKWFDNAKGYAEKPEQAEAILRRLSDAARELKDADLGG